MDEFKSVDSMPPRTDLERIDRPTVVAAQSPERSAVRTKILFLCNPCIDQLYSCSLGEEDMFRQLGFSRTTNTLFGKDDILQKLETEGSYKFESATPAGSLRNTAATMQLLRKNIGATGIDNLVIAGPYTLRSSQDNEAAYIRDLQSRDIEYRPLSTVDTDLQRILRICCISLDRGNGERYMASNTMTYPNVDGTGILEDAKELLVEGYAYQGNEDIFDKIMQTAKRQNIHVGFALSARDIVEADKDKILDLIEQKIIRTIYCNEEECKELLGEEYNNIAEFTRKNCLRIVETLGKRGARLVDEKGVAHEVQLPKNCEVIQPNTLGAGDTFLGGYLVGKALDLRTEEDCINLGIAAASQVLRVPEAIMQEDGVEEVKKIFARNTGINIVGGKPVYQIMKKQEYDIQRLF